MHSREKTMIHNSIGLTLAVITCSGLVISAQAPPPAQQPAPQTPSAQTIRQSNTTLVGCVYQEKDVPGRSPNIAEKAGVLEDYILAEIRPSATTATPGAAGTSGAAQFGTMYKLEHADDSK